MSKTTGYIMKAFMWVIGFAALGYGIYFLSINTSNWPQTEAVVTSSERSTSDDSGNYTYNTSYEFEVDGVMYEASVNDYTEYAKGDKITVYYDPNDPSTTITSQGEMGFLGCIGVLFGLFAIGSMTWGAIKARKSVAAAQPTTE